MTTTAAIAIAVTGKDFEDTRNGGRRIFYGWATVETNPQTLARVVTYHPQLKQLVFSPAPEYEKLHGSTIAHLGESSETRILDEPVEWIQIV